MAKTVYLLGAGTNAGVRHRTRGTRSPLARDFFRQLHQGLNTTELARLRDDNIRLYEYIDHYWKLDVQKLSTADFDLEECFTLLEQQEKDAERRQHYADYQNLWEIKGQLTSLLAGLLDDISSNQPTGEDGLAPLARRVLNEGAAVVTFNYDTLLEQAMISESSHAWDPIPAYSAPFDLFEPQDGGPAAEFRSARFPPQDHAAPFLKMHGSLNWFRFVGGEVVEEAPGMFVQRPERLWQTLVRPVGGPVMNSSTGHTFVMPGGTLLEQLIITPVLNKNVDEQPFARIWRKARGEMRSCSQLVVCGYSFPPTDFATRRLFLESFAGGSPDELVVINPDKSVVRRVKDLCHFEGPISVCDNLQQFLGR